MDRQLSVMIAVDGTDASVRAAAVARRMFGPESTFTFVHVDDEIAPSAQPLVAVPGAGAAMPPVVHERDLAEGEDAAITRARSVAGRAAYDAGMANAVAIGLVGETATTLASEAAHRGIDVIVVPGEPSRGWFSRLFSSSATAELEQAATVPVLVVPTPG